MSRARLGWTLLLVAVAGAALWWLATSQDARLFALDAESGSVRWSAELPSGTRLIGDPVVGGDLVVVQTARPVNFFGDEANVQVTAYDSRTGRQRWQYTPPLDPVRRESFPRVRFPIPRMADRHVLIAEPHDDGSSVLAIDLETGQPAWTVERLSFGDQSRYADIAAAGGRVFATRQEGGELWVLALDERDGTILWRAPTGATWLPDSHVGPFVLASPESVFVSTHKSLLALDAATGEQRFRIDDTLVERSGGIALDGGTVFRRTDVTAIAAYDATTGQERWAFRQPYSTGGGALRAFGAGDGLLVVNCSCGDARLRDGGLLFGVDGRTGQERWRVQLGRLTNVYRNLPDIVAGVVVTGTEESQAVIARSTVDGSVRWRLTRQVGGYVATDGATVYAADRDVRWRHWLALLGLFRQSASFD